MELLQIIFVGKHSWLSEKWWIAKNFQLKGFAIWLHFNAHKDLWHVHLLTSQNLITAATYSVCTEGLQFHLSLSYVATALVTIWYVASLLWYEKKLRMPQIKFFQVVTL